MIRDISQFSPVLSSNQCSVLTSTQFSPALSFHQYSVLTSNQFSSVLSSHQYSVLTNSQFSPVLSSHQYSVLISTQFYSATMLIWLLNTSAEGAAQHFFGGLQTVTRKWRDCQPLKLLRLNLKFKLGGSATMKQGAPQQFSGGSATIWTIQLECASWPY